MLWLTLALAGDRPGAVIRDGEHPLNIACTKAFGAKRLNACVERSIRRRHAAAEVAACGGLTEEKAAFDCMVRLERRGSFNTSSTIAACAETFNKSGLHCARATETAIVAAPELVRTCASSFNDDKRALACISQFAGAGVDAGPGVGACMEHLGDRGEKCLGLIATASTPMEHVIEQCAATGDSGVVLKCVGRFVHASVEASAGIQACTEAFSEQTDRCLDLVVHARVPLQGVIHACADVLDNEKEALKCASGFVEATIDGAGAILACGTLGPYRDECINRVRQASAPLGPIIDACAAGLEGKLAMRCVSLLIEKRRATGPSVAACMDLFIDPGDRLKCVELGHAKDAAKLLACDNQAEIRARLTCVER